VIPVSGGMLMILLWCFITVILSDFASDLAIVGLSVGGPNPTFITMALVLTVA